MMQQCLYLSSLMERALRLSERGLWGLAEPLLLVLLSLLVQLIRCWARLLSRLAYCHWRRYYLRQSRSPFAWGPQPAQGFLSVHQS